MAEVPNPQLLLYALYLEGGGQGFVELEDLFERCWRLFPSRFGWRSKPHPSDKAGDQALRHAVKRSAEPGESTVQLSEDRSSARLTAKGVAFVRKHEPAFAALAQSKAPTSSRRSQRHLIELERHPVGLALATGGELTASRTEIADLLRLTPDADLRDFRARVASWRSDAESTERTTAATILDRLIEARPEWFQAASTAAKGKHTNE